MPPVELEYWAKNLHRVYNDYIKSDNNQKTSFVMERKQEMSQNTSFETIFEG